MNNQNGVIHAALRSGMGNLRKNNEDAFFFDGLYQPLDEMNSETAMEADAPMAGALFSVCDGMGGQDQGEVASYTAVSGLQDLKKHLFGRDFAATMQNWVFQADQAIAHATQGGGCTLALIYFDGEKVHYAHIGDSRIYRMHQGSLIPLSRDHSKVEMMIAAGMITPEEARVHPQRHVITRYLGMHSEAVCEASIGRVLPAMDGDRYLLCSDGITDMLDDAQIEKLCRENSNVVDCVDAVYRAGLAAGGRDNLTVIVMDVENGWTMIPDEEEEEPTLEPSLTEEKTISSAVSCKENGVKTFTLHSDKQTGGKTVISTNVSLSAEDTLRVVQIKTRICR